MNNTDWKILIYLKEERSINKVAKRLFMTQPSLTYRLGQMEKEIPGHCPRPGQFFAASAQKKIVPARKTRYTVLVKV